MPFIIIGLSMHLLQFYGQKTTCGRGMHKDYGCDVRCEDDVNILLVNVIYFFIAAWFST